VQRYQVRCGLRLTLPLQHGYCKSAKSHGTQSLRSVLAFAHDRVARAFLYPDLARYEVRSFHLFLDIFLVYIAPAISFLIHQTFATINVLNLTYTSPGCPSPSLVCFTALLTFGSWFSALLHPPLSALWPSSHSVAPGSQHRHFFERLRLSELPWLVPFSSQPPPTPSFPHPSAVDMANNSSTFSHRIWTKT
jgi:hypothetical protein